MYMYTKRIIDVMFNMGIGDKVKKEIVRSQERRKWDKKKDYIYIAVISIMFLILMDVKIEQMNRAEIVKKAGELQLLSDTSQNNAGKF